MGIAGYRSRPIRAVLALSAALGLPAAFGAGNTGQAEALERYQQERAACIGGQSNQDQATCLREAGAALAEAKRSRLDDAAEDYAANALKRCARLPGDDRQDCEARMQGQGTTSGSVAAGGIYRELVTRKVGPPNGSQEPSM